MNSTRRIVAGRKQGPLDDGDSLLSSVLHFLPHSHSGPRGSTSTS